MSEVVTHTVKPIAVIESPFKEKFGIPRQPNLVGAKGIIRITENDISADAFKGIEQHSHLWLLFLFDEHIDRGWKAQVRPPRLGGNEKVGVFATRSTFRPNCIGMSVVKFIDIKQVDGITEITVQGIDLLDGTPIIDIKPYIPYADSVNSASSLMAHDAPDASLTVLFSAKAESNISQLKITSDVCQLIEQVLAQDPRPSYKQKKDDDKVYGIKLDKYNIKWQVKSVINTQNPVTKSADYICEVTEIELV